MFLVVGQSPSVEVTFSVSSTLKHFNSLLKYVTVFIRICTMCSILLLENLSFEVLVRYLF
jgi:hypothetical protein